jgi:peptidoglycan/xylan/chitin deacetylase (PgdA/CDA1 family)
MRAAVSWFLLAFLVLTGDVARAGDTGAGASVPILVYHRFGSVATELTTIRTETFVEELEWLHANRIAVIPLHQLIDRLRAGQDPADSPSVVLTADDGHESVYTDMYPLIKQYRTPITLFVYPSAISNSKTALTWDQLSKMAASGLVEVQSHTFWHPDFHVEKSRLTPTEYQQFTRNQLVLSKTRIEAHLHHQVDLLSWPFGIHDSQLEKWAAEVGYVAGFGIEHERVRRGDDLFALPRFEVTDADRGTRFAALVSGRPAKGVHQ